MGKGNKLTEPSKTSSPWGRFSLILLFPQSWTNTNAGLCMSKKIYMKLNGQNSIAVALKTGNLKGGKKSEREKKGIFCFTLCFYKNKNWLIIPAWLKISWVLSLTLPLLGCNMVNKLNCLHIFRQCKRVKEPPVLSSWALQFIQFPIQCWKSLWDWHWSVSQQAAVTTFQRLNQLLWKGIHLYPIWNDTTTWSNSHFSA